MKKKLWLQFSLATIALILFLFTYNYQIFKKKKLSLSEDLKTSKKQEIGSNVSSILENISYDKIDLNGNTFELKSKFSEILKDKKDINYMKIVDVKITLNDGRIILITSDNGIYNQKTTNAWLNGNVILTEADNKITSDNLDLKFTENFITAYNNVVYKYPKGGAEADKIEVFLDKKIAKTYMYDNDKKVFFNYAD